MGQVNRALDTKLDRDVALKVLPQAFTEDLDVAVVDVGERILWHGKFWTKLGSVQLQDVVSMLARP